MAEVIRMPLLSDTMKEGIIAEWHKKVGDKVLADDVIADVETDKATMEVMPYVSGTLLYIGVEKGKGVPVNGIMAIIGAPSENFQHLLGENSPTSVVKSDTKKEVATTETIEIEAPQAAGERVKASPLAKKLAQEKGLDIHEVTGSGDGGRIIKRDVDNFIPVAKNSNSQQAVAKVVNIPEPNESYVDIPLTQMRKIIAQRLSESKFGAPHFYLRITLHVDKLIEARKFINSFSRVKISINDMIIKACAQALLLHPYVNSSWMGEFIRQNKHINIGTAVAVEEGLIVPVVKHADTKSLSQIAEETAILYEKARNKKIQPQEFTGNTFTISNLGMMDIDEFTAIINPPDSCILAVGKITATPVVENNAIQIKQLMKLTLSCDHRVVDGAKGALFLQTLKKYLEEPVAMLA